MSEITDKWAYEDRDPKIYKTYGSLLYHPAASACFAYEPNAVNLADRFKKHNWFLPASGDLARLMYYGYHSYDINSGKPAETPVESQYDDSYNAPANAFANAMKLGVLYTGFRSTSYFFSSTESGYSGDSAVIVHGKTGRIQEFTKSAQASVIPICAF